VDYIGVHKMMPRGRDGSISSLLLLLLHSELLCCPARQLPSHIAAAIAIDALL